MERREMVEWITIGVLGIYVSVTFETDPVISAVAGIIAIALLLKLLVEPVGEVVERHREMFDLLLLLLIVAAILLSIR